MAFNSVTLTVKKFPHLPALVTKIPALWDSHLVRLKSTAITAQHVSSVFRLEV
jgi:hypothetical protein